MSDTTDYNAPLGVGTLIGDTFTVFKNSFLKAMVMGFCILLIVGLLTEAILGDLSQMSEAQVQATMVMRTVPLMFVTILGYTILNASLVQLAYDAKLGRSPSLGACFMTGIRNTPMILILSIAFIVMFYIGLFLAVIPGIWVLGVFAMFVPALVIEKAGFGALGRSRRLTKGYRWPIIGLFILMWIIIMIIQTIISFPLLFAVGFNPIANFGAPMQGIAAILITALTGAVTYSLLAISNALAYARLREIKEGVNTTDLVEVFS